MAEAERRQRWMAPLKPNVVLLAGAIVALVWLCVRATTGVVADTLPTLLASEIADEVRASALHLLGVVAGMQFASLAIAGLVSWGIKLLDEREEPPPPEPPPSVPAATHEAVVAALTRDRDGDQTVLDALEREAKP